MNKIKNLISKFKKKENKFKFSKGDIVRIDTNDGFYFTGEVFHTEVGSKENICIVGTYGGSLRFPESCLKHIKDEDERDWKLKQLLNKTEH